MVAPDSSVFQPRTSSRGWSHHRVGKSDVEWLEQQTRALRAADHQSGGGACLSNLLKLIDRVQPMLGAASILTANQAWAHAAMGNDTAALRLLHESQELLALADPTHVPGWESFFT